MYKSILLYITLVGLSACTTLKTDFVDTPTPSSSIYTAPIINKVKAVNGDIQSPYNHVCRSQVLRQTLWLKKSNAVSSSAMLSNGVIVSAGHNYYSPWYNIVKALYIECGVGTSPNQLPLFAVENTITDLQILANKNYSWDFSNDVSFVRICGSNGFSSSSSFRLATKKEMKLIKKGTEIYSAGYPADGPWKGGQQLTHFTTTISKIKNNIALYTDMTTYKGMSGSAIWIKLDNEFVIVGVHVTNGGAYVFTSNFLDEYSNWMKKLNDSGCS